VGEIGVDRVGLLWSGREAAVEAEVELGLVDTQPLRFDATVAVPPGVDLRTIDAWRQHASFRAELDRLDLGVFAPFVPRGVREVTGFASGSVSLSPGRSGWSAVGRLDVEEGGLTVPALRQRFEPVEIRARLEGSRVTLERVRVGPDGDGASLQATVELDPALDFPITGELRLDRLALRRARLVETRLSGGIQLTGSLGAPVVRGALALDDTRVTVPAAGDPIMKEIRILTRDRDASLREASAAAEPPIFGRADVDMSFSAPRTTRVRGQGAQLFVEGDVRATRRPGEPLRLRGEANVVNGTYSFQGRQFRVRRGTVRLAGDEQVDPLLDVEAHRRVREIVAIVEVSGRLSSPVIRLRSEPDLPERDVLSYLVFGRPAEEVGAAQEANFDAAAAQLAAGVAEQELHEVLGDAMPIDTIEIEADESGETSEVGFGKYIGPDLYVRYLHVLGDEPADQVGVEYRLNENFSIGSSVSTTGDTGLDLILRHDF
jgi:autotransporter translocation and assembly factor TamB